jgi:hypothetical protein
MTNFTLNTVYDYWNGDNPIPNGYTQYPKKHFWVVEEYINSYINSFSDTNIRIKNKNCKMSEVYENPNQKYYYFICHATMNIDEIVKDNLVISEDVKKCLDLCKNFNLVFLSHHESDDENGFLALHNSNLPQNQIYIVNNNHKLTEYVNKHNSKIKVHSSMFLPVVVSASLREINGTTFSVETKEKFFMCFNRAPRIQRYSILLFMLKNNLLEDTNWSLIPLFSVNFNCSSYSEIFEMGNCENYLEEIKYLNELKLKVSDYEVTELSFDDNNQITVLNPKYANVLMPPEIPSNYINSYVNIVTESQFLDKYNVIQITEKSLKPFFYYQFPMILATHHHKKSLQEKYGFDFFDDIIDHSYDNEMNQKKRFGLFIKEIKRLYDNKERLIEFYKNNQHRFEENKKRVIEIEKNKSDYFFMRSLLD